MRQRWIFDYDDLLAPNMHDYSYPQITLIQYLIDSIGPRCPDVPAIMREEENIDREAVNAMGFNKERFPTSFVRTYEEICKTLGIEAMDKARKEIYDIGMTAFDFRRWKKQGLFPNVAETLDFLLEKGDELILLTKGDPKVQERKIEATNIRKWFGNSIYIVPKKDKDTLIQLASGYDSSHVWHVGNSIRSDVEPALEADINMIYIRLETWAYEKQHKGIPDNPRLHIFTDIIEIKNKYKILTKS